MIDAERDRILMVVENSHYPQDPRVRHEAAALVEAGYRVTVIAPGKKGQPSRDVVNGVQVYRYPYAPRGSGLLGYLWEYGYCMAATFILSLRVAREQGFDVVHAANPPDTFVFIGAFYKLFGKKFVFDHHDLSAEMYDAKLQGKGNRWVYRTLLVLEKLSCRLADHVIATNESYRAIEMARCGVPERRITVVRNGPDLNRLQRLPWVQPPEGNYTKVIGYVGLTGSQDGIDYLLRALHHLAYGLGRTDFKCVVVGEGDALPGLKQLSGELGLAEFVEFAGYLPYEEIGGRLAQVDICVAPEPATPYLSNSTAIKMLEYMAMAKPIVAFDLREHRYSARDAALYAKPNDEMEYARLLVRLMDDPELRRTMGEAGRIRAETELAWPFSAPRLIEAYKLLLGDERLRVADGVVGHQLEG